MNNKAEKSKGQVYKTCNKKSKCIYCIKRVYKMIALNNKIKDSTNYTYEVCEYKIYLI
jgi:hypothetical protein